MNKKYLFFIVHPSKYHVFRNTINILKSKGHKIDIFITSKDVLEELIKNEGWNYTNIFPEGRKIKGISTYLSALINTFRTIYRIHKYVRKNQYDLMVTDDLLVINAKFRKIPSILFQDDDVTAVPESKLLHYFATYILSPSVSNMGKFERKKIGFYGFKELGSLYPTRFSPDINIIKSFNPDLKPYFLIRLVSLRATHDIGKSGLTNADIEKIITQLSKCGYVYITSERVLPEKFEKYRLNIKPNDICKDIMKNLK